MLLMIYNEDKQYTGYGKETSIQNKKINIDACMCKIFSGLIFSPHNEFFLKNKLEIIIF